MGKNEHQIDLSTITKILFKSYRNGETYPISNVSKIIEIDDNYLITAHNMETSFPKNSICFEKLTDAS